jgi:5-methylcytosine-specific restriction endonuclease McrA
MVLRHNPSSKIISEVPLAEVLEFANRRQNKKFKHENREYSVTRMRVFAMHGCKCHFCGLEGTKIILTEDGGGALHLDLYAEKRNSRRSKGASYILMNRDHIRPASLGGSNSVWNMRPTCAPCNSKRGNHYTLKDKVMVEGRQRMERFYQYFLRQGFNHTSTYDMCTKMVNTPNWLWAVLKKIPRPAWHWIHGVVA